MRDADWLYMFGNRQWRRSGAQQKQGQHTHLESNVYYLEASLRVSVATDARL